MPLFRPRLESITTCAHGGPDYRELEELGIPLDELADFSVNCNPFGPPPSVRAAAGRACWERLPDTYAAALRKMLSGILAIDTANIVTGNGSVELIRFIALSFFGPGDMVVVPQPTFGEYETSLGIAGATPLLVRCSEASGFQLDLPGLERVLRGTTGGQGRKNVPRGLFLCNPNNPTGTYLSRAEVEGLLDALPDGLVVLDEAYLPFVEEPWDSLDLLDRGNLVVLRSMTKDYALGGLRLGYAAGPQPLMETLRRVLPPWNVNAVAQEAGVLALEDPEYPSRCLPAIVEARNYLMSNLEKMDLKVLPSRTNYFLVQVGNASGFRRSLLKEGFLVRDCQSFGMPDYIRISARTMPECQRLVQAAHRLLDRGMARP